MDETVVKVDSKGHIRIPHEFREELGGMVIQKNKEGHTTLFGRESGFHG